MGRLLLIALIIVAVILLWKAFGPSLKNRTRQSAPDTPAIKGPDDDEEFLWTIEKQRFKERREREAREQNKQADKQADKERRKPQEDEDPEP